MENDFGCNLGRGADSARFIEEINSPHLKLLWDPGNAYFVGENAYPTGYEASKHVLGHVHVKDAVYDPQTDEYRWVSLGSGEVEAATELIERAVNLIKDTHVKTVYTVPLLT